MVRSVLQCDWCMKEFTPTEAMPSKCYDLNNAGKTICLDCCDKWTDVELKLHLDKLICFIDEAKGKLLTFNGFPLPLSIFQWKIHRSFKHLRKRPMMDIVDTYGRNWVAERINDSMCLLRPIGRPKWSK